MEGPGNESRELADKREPLSGKLPDQLSFLAFAGPCQWALLPVIPPLSRVTAIPLTEGPQSKHSIYQASTVSQVLCVRRVTALLISCPTHMTEASQRRDYPMAPNRLCHWHYSPHFINEVALPWDSNQGLSGLRG